MKNFAVKYGLWFRLFGSVVFGFLGAFLSQINRTYTFLYVLFIIALLLIWCKIETIWFNNKE